MEPNMQAGSFNTNQPLEADEFEALLGAARAGDQAARERLAARYYPRVEAMVHRELARDMRQNRPWMSARFSTGDVVQDVFRSLLQDLSQFEGRSEDAFVGYLSMVIRNRLVDALRFHEAARRDGRRTSVLPEEPDSSTQPIGPGTRMAASEEIERYQDALAQFSEKEQLLIRARLECQTSFPDLAQQLGYSSKWAASRAFYAAQAKLLILLG
jgi:RNA polymerase sigma factor (sigma-70 family)